MARAERKKGKSFQHRRAARFTWEEFGGDRGGRGRMCFAFASGVLPPGIFEKQLKNSENCPNFQKVVTLYNEM